MDFKKITGSNDYSLEASKISSADKELKKLTLFQITNIVAKINPITDKEVCLEDILKYAKENPEKISCKYNSIKRSGLNLKRPGRNVSYLLFKSGKVSFIGLKVKDYWSTLLELTSEKSAIILEEINERIREEIENFKEMIKDCVEIDPNLKLTYEITNLVWDLVNIYTLNISKLASQNSYCVNFDPEIFIAASYKPFKGETIEGEVGYKGSFNIFGSKRAVYTGSKSVIEFKEASNRFVKLLIPYAHLPKPEDYQRLIDFELKLKLENRLKRKNKIPGKRGRRPKIVEK